jgi:hypothetical protein
MKRGMSPEGVAKTATIGEGSVGLTEQMVMDTALVLIIEGSIVFCFHFRFSFSL